jgi:hypothetical protein
MSCLSDSEASAIPAASSHNTLAKRRYIITGVEDDKKTKIINTHYNSTLLHGVL